MTSCGSPLRDGASAWRTSRFGGRTDQVFDFHLGFSAGAFDAGMEDNPSSRVRYMVIPHWFQVAAAALIVAAMAAVLVRRGRRSRLAGTGRCRACGYDFRATPERCPECGAGLSGDPPGQVDHVPAVG